MIIPVRCFGCGKPVGHLWEQFKERVASGENQKKCSMNLDWKVCVADRYFGSGRYT